MPDRQFAKEIGAVLLQLFHKDNLCELEEWKSLTPLERGVLSWHVGSFYCYFLW